MLEKAPTTPTVSAASARLGGLKDTGVSVPAAERNSERRVESTVKVAVAAVDGLGGSNLKLRFREQFSYDEEVREELNLLIKKALSISNKDDRLFKEDVGRKRRKLIEKILVATLPELRINPDKIVELLR